MLIFHFKTTVIGQTTHEKEIPVNTRIPYQLLYCTPTFFTRNFKMSLNTFFMLEEAFDTVNNSTLFLCIFSFKIT